MLQVPDKTRSEMRNKPFIIQSSSFSQNSCEPLFLNRNPEDIWRESCEERTPAPCHTPTSESFGGGCRGHGAPVRSATCRWEARGLRLPACQPCPLAPPTLVGAAPPSVRDLGGGAWTHCSQPSHEPLPPQVPEPVGAGSAIPLPVGDWVAVARYEEGKGGVGPL